MNEEQVGKHIGEPVLKAGLRGGRAYRVTARGDEGKDEGEKKGKRGGERIAKMNERIKEEGEGNNLEKGEGGEWRDR